MKIFAYVLGILTGLAFSRIPHYVGPIFNDQPITPAGHETKSRYWSGGVPVERSWLDDAADEAGFEKVSGL